MVEHRSNGPLSGPDRSSRSQVVATREATGAASIAIPDLKTESSGGAIVVGWVVKYNDREFCSVYGTRSYSYDNNKHPVMVMNIK